MDGDIRVSRTTDQSEHNLFQQPRHGYGGQRQATDEDAHPQRRVDRVEISEEGRRAYEAARAAAARAEEGGDVPVRTTGSSPAAS